MENQKQEQRTTATTKRSGEKEIKSQGYTKETEQGRLVELNIKEDRDKSSTQTTEDTVT